MSYLNAHKHGYKHTTLGWIPEEWSVEKIFNVTNYVDYRGATPAKTSFGRFLVTARNIKNGYIDYSLSQEFVAEDEYEYIMRRGKPKIGDVLITTEAPLGSVAQIDKEDIALAQRVIKYRSKNGGLDNTFLKYWLLSDHFQRILDNKSTGSTAKGIKGSVLHKLPIILPAFMEQRKIATILSTWDAAITKTQQLIAELKKRNKGLIQQLLTGKKRLRGFEGKEWKKLHANEIFRSVSVKNQSSEQLLSATQDKGIIPRSMLEARVTMPAGETDSFKLVEKGDFVISLRSFQGGIEYSEYRGLVSPAYTVLKPTREINNSYYKYYFKSYDFIGHLAVAVIGIRDGKQVSYEDFSFLKLPYPSVEEQEAIVKVLDAAINEVKLYKQKLASIKQQKRGLMQKLLTGEIRVQV